MKMKIACTLAFFFARLQLYAYFLKNCSEDVVIHECMCLHARFPVMLKGDSWLASSYLEIIMRIFVPTRNSCSKEFHQTASIRIAYGFM